MGKDAELYKFKAGSRSRITHSGSAQPLNLHSLLVFTVFQSVKQICLHNPSLYIFCALPSLLSIRQRLQYYVQYYYICTGIYCTAPVLHYRTLSIYIYIYSKCILLASLGK